MSQSPLTIILLIILGMSGICIIIMGMYFLLRSNSVQERLRQYVEPTAEITSPVDRRKTDRFSRFRYQLNNALSILASEKLQLQLLRANWPISVTEYILIRFVISLLAFLIGWLAIKNLFIGIGAGFISYLIPGMLLLRSIFIRQRKFADQLVDALVLIRGAVQTGYSFMQALDVVIDELPQPASEEFDRVKREIQLGLPLGRALLNLSARMENDDLHMMVTAVIINNQVGGNLTTMLTAVTETIRARMQLFGEVRALTSYSRYTSGFLTLLPVFAVLAIFFLNPTYFNTAFTSPITQIILMLAAINVVLGNFWLRRIANVKV